MMDLLPIMARPSAVGDVPEAVSFDGVTDYLSRSSDLVGNTDSKTFTFSCWVYPTRLATEFILESETLGKIQVYMDGSSNIRFYTQNTTSAVALDVKTKLPINTWSNVILSVDLANTLNRYLCVNDIQVSPTWSKYVDSSIDFTQSGYFVAGRSIASSLFKGRLSHLYLDYTYRDLSIEANRRLFITEDGKPADGQAALSPILYLPMKDAATAHSNEGSGGDFVQNGTLDTASRGPNQWNCVASEFDGVDDYLSSTGIGASDGKQFTFSFNGTVNSDISVIPLAISDSASTYGLLVQLRKITSGSSIRLFGQNESNVGILDIESDAVVVAGKHLSISMSVDMSDNLKTILVVNGESINVTHLTLTDDFLDFTRADNRVGGIGTSYVDGSMGELYFDTQYIDLATDNPFWDSEANRPKPVAQVINETGHVPLIAMPLSADNPEKNLGTGGDFTLNGGGLTGARGGSEFWSRSAKFDGSTGYLSNTPIGANLITKTLSFVVPISRNTITAALEYIFDIRESDGGPILSLFINTDERIDMIINNAAGTDIYKIINVKNRNGVDYDFADEWDIIMVSINLEDSTSTFRVGEQVYDSLVTIELDEFITFSVDDQIRIGNNISLSSIWNGSLAGAYFTTDYIDFSNESNRNLFVSQLGYPKDLSPAIEEGTIPTPLFYLKFDEADNLGKDSSGNDNNFVVNGTVTQGADFNV